MSDIKEMTAISKRMRNDRGWRKFHDPKNLAMDICAEAAEILEHFLWVNKKEVRNYSTAKKKEIADELADVMNPILLLADALKIDLRASFEDKMARTSKKYPVEKVKGKHTNQSGTV